MSDLTRAILESVVASESHPMSLDGCRAAIESPEFEETGRVHDWRNYPPAEVIALWDRLPEEARAVAFVMAYELASSEIWD